MRYEISGEARADLRDIRKFLSARSPALSERVLTAITDRIARLPDFPRARSIPEEYERPRIRQSIVGDYRIFYAVGEDTLVVTAVVHVSRQL